MSLIAYGLIALAIFGAIGTGVYKVKQWGGNEVRAEWDADKAAARKREAELSAFAAKALSEERAKRKVVIEKRTVHVDREVEKPIYRDRCLPDTGVCLANASITGKVAPGCLSDGTVSPVKPAG